MGNPPINFDINKSLEELEDSVWEEDNRTGLISKITKLRKKPLVDYSNEDLRLMIGQQFSLEFIIQIALERLANNHFVTLRWWGAVNTTTLSEIRVNTKKRIDINEWV